MSIVSDLVSGGIKGIFDSISGVIRAVHMNPNDEAALLAQVAQAKEAALVQLATIDAQVIASVNASMQAEAKSEHWLQYSWRPMGAYIFYLLIIHNYVLASYFGHWGITRLEVPDNVWFVFTALLGVTAYTRGMQQVAQTQNGNGKH